MQLCPVFLVYFRDLNSETCACTTDTLPTEPSPKSIKISILQESMQKYQIILRNVVTDPKINKNLYISKI